MEKTPRVVILDTTEITDFANYGGMLYMLKRTNLVKGRDFQIDNAGGLLMNYKAFCKGKKFLISSA